MRKKHSFYIVGAWVSTYKSIKIYDFRCKNCNMIFEIAESVFWEGWWPGAPVAPSSGGSCRAAK
jgi:hypothetical protein